MTSSSIFERLEEEVVLIEPLQCFEGKIAPEILIAPKTGGDPEGKWLLIGDKLVKYLENNVVGNPWSDHLVLMAIVMTARRNDVTTVLNTITNLNTRWTNLFPVLGLQTMNDWKPEKHIPLYLRGEILPKDSESMRITFWSRYNGATRTVWNWYRSLPDINKQVYEPFVLKTLEYDHVEGLVKLKEVRDQQRKIRKSETDALLPHYPQLRAEAHFRYNKIVRLREAWYKALKELNISSLPFAFSYQEDSEQLYFRIWNRRSFVLAHQDQYSQLTVSNAQNREGNYSLQEEDALFLEFVKAERLVRNAPTEGLWFQDLLREGVLGSGPCRGSNKETVARRLKFLQSWGYGEEDSSDTKCAPFRTNVSGLLSWRQVGGESWFMSNAQEIAEGVLVPLESLYPAATFGLLVIDLITTTGMRINEVMQTRLSEDCFHCVETPPTTQNKSPTFRYLFRLIPKGERTDTPHNYFIGEETKRVLVKVAKMLEEHYDLDIEKGETLPEVKFNPENRRSHRFEKEKPYLFQYRQQHLSSTAITSCMRFLLHGMIVKTREGKTVTLKCHLLRHGFATHAVQVEKVPVDVLGAWLHQKNLDVTKYYSEVTESMVAEAADFFLARLATYINVGKSIIRSPSELEKQFQEAFKQMGTLNQVNGGDCTYHGFCPSQFSCNGCSAKVPDPSKRYQVEHQKKWALSKLEFVNKEGLLPEAEKIKQHIRDCDTDLQEMDLMEQFRKDEKYVPKIRIEQL